MNKAVTIAAVLTVLVCAALEYRDRSAASPETARPAGRPAQAARPAGVKPAASAPVVDLFPSQSWQPAPPPPPAASAPPARPSGPPPLPFTLAGIWQDGDEQVVFIHSGPRLLALCARCRTEGALRPGAHIVGGYRLVGIAPAYVEFEHLPGKERQRLNLGSF